MARVSQKRKATYDAFADTRLLGQITERERAAGLRVLRARVKAPESAILAWVRSIGPESVLSATLSDIRAIANAF